MKGGQNANNMKMTVKFYYLLIILSILYSSCTQKDKIVLDNWVIKRDNDSNQTTLLYNNKFIGRFTFDSSESFIYSPIGNKNKLVFLDSVGVNKIGQYKEGKPFGRFFFFDENIVLRDIAWYHSDKPFLKMYNIKSTSAYIPNGNPENIISDLITLPNIFLRKKDLSNEDESYRLSIYSESFPIQNISVQYNFTATKMELDFISNSYTFNFEAIDTIKLVFSYKDIDTGGEIKSLTFERSIKDLLNESSMKVW